MTRHADRNHAIFVERSKGARVKDLSKKYGLSSSRISKIVASQRIYETRETAGRRRTSLELNKYIKQLRGY